MINSRRVKSLAEQMRMQLLWTGLVLFLVCIVLVFSFAWRAMDLTINHLALLEAKSLIRLMQKNTEIHLPDNGTYHAYKRWEDIPEPFRKSFDGVTVVLDKLAQAEWLNHEGIIEQLYLLHHVDENFGNLFILSKYTNEDVETISYTLFTTALSQALWLTLIIFVGLFFLIRWLIQRTTSPLTLLSEWAVDLGKNPSQSLNIDFPIDELNKLAMQLHEGVERIQAYNEREQQFLKHASHELRTPLAIIQASLDTLSLQANDEAQRSVQRALRASANIARMSSALLWLARESERPIEKNMVEVVPLLNQIVDDNRYLLVNRDVNVALKINVESLEIEIDLLSILISNLVRNAFQYCVSGEVAIEVSAIGLTIYNPISEHVTTSSGFGLGLQMVQRICQKLNWQFSFSRQKKWVNVTVTWQ